MLKEIAGTRAYNILKKRKMETVEDVCQLFPSKYYDFSFINGDLLLKIFLITKKIICILQKSYILLQRINAK